MPEPERVVLNCESVGLRARNNQETKRQLERRWEKAGIGDDFIFSCVMRKEEFFLPLMQRIFPEMKLCRVEKHIPQMTVYGAAGAEKLSGSCQRGETGG